MLRRYSTRSKLTLRKPAFPVKHIVENPNKYAESITARRVELHNRQSMADLLAQHERVNELKHQRIIAGAERNAVVAKVKAAVSAQNKRDVLPEDLRAESAANKQKISNIDAQLGELEHGFSELLESVPNLVDPHVMSISGDYEVVHRTGPESPAGDPSLDHVEIGSYLGILDVPNASRVSGMGNAYLVGQGALLEQALIAYALKK